MTNFNIAVKSKRVTDSSCSYLIQDQKKKSKLDKASLTGSGYALGILRQLTTTLRNTIKIVFQPGPIIGERCCCVHELLDTATLIKDTLVEAEEAGKNDFVQLFILHNIINIGTLFCGPCASRKAKTYLHRSGMNINLFGNLIYLNFV